MHDDFAEVLLMQQEVVADPEQILLALLNERNAGPHAGMSKKEIAAGKRQPQILQEIGGGYQAKRTEMPLLCPASCLGRPGCWAANRMSAGYLFRQLVSTRRE